MSHQHHNIGACIIDVADIFMSIILHMQLSQQNAKGLTFTIQWTISLSPNPSVFYNEDSAKHWHPSMIKTQC